MLPNEEKNLQRKICLQNRRALSEEQRKNYSEQICASAADLPEFQSAKLVFSYMASFDEADPSYLPKEGKVFCYPVSLPGGIMEVRIPAEEDGWEEGKFGIVSPRTDNSVLVNPEDIDLIIVPCVGFDENKNRLGHGKGYYDRYIPKCPRAKLICIAFEAQKLHNVVVDRYDAPMEYVVTEKKVY